jgi:hypothetical protein
MKLKGGGKEGGRKGGREGQHGDVGRKKRETLIY